MADNTAPASAADHPEGPVDACPSTRALELIAGKWALRIFPALENGPVRNNELLRRVGDLDDWVKTHWQEMERIRAAQVDSE